MEILGIDIGGSGIKGAPVDTSIGKLLAERHRIPTPAASTPQNVAQVVAQMAKHFQWSGPIGCTFPAVVQHGMVRTAANVDKGWIGTNGEALLQQATGCSVYLLNDADAAGIAEMRFGAGKEQEDGVVFLLTLGTGIGSAVFVEGNLLPNTELGHLELRGKAAEHRAAERIREEKELSWKEWGGRVNEYLNYLEFLFSPDLFIIGGGVSKQHDKFFPYLSTKAPIVPAKLRNEAGIVGAAIAAEEHMD